MGSFSRTFVYTAGRTIPDEGILRAKLQHPAASGHARGAEPLHSRVSLVCRRCQLLSDISQLHETASGANVGFDAGSGCNCARVVRSDRLDDTSALFWGQTRAVNRSAICRGHGAGNTRRLAGSRAATNREQNPTLREGAEGARSDEISQSLRSGGRSLLLPADDQI